MQKIITAICAIAILLSNVAQAADGILLCKKGEYSGVINNIDDPKEAPAGFDDELPDILDPANYLEPEPTKTEKFKSKIKHTFKKEKKKKSPYKESKRVEKLKYSHIKSQNKAPKTFAEYLEMSKDVKREDMKVPRPSFQHDSKLVDLPDPALRITKYNNPPGRTDIDLRLLTKQRQLPTKSVLSPDNKRVAYSVVYSYPTTQQVASELFIINIPDGTSQISALRDFHTIEAEREPVLKTGTDRLFENEKRTFVILDWSEDGQKIAVKEKIGAQTQGPWKTQIQTYDFETKKGYQLTALPEAVRYYWKTRHNLDLIDYMWDIYPLGWDLYNKDRIVAFAYAYGKNNSGIKFLGTWSIDYKNQRTELMSEDATDFEVSINGFKLQLKREESY